MATLDSGVGKSIATKPMWERWGKSTLHKTQMNLQLAHDSLNNPIGIVEDITMESCGIEYEHIFAIIDFKMNTNYEAILGQANSKYYKIGDLTTYTIDKKHLLQESTSRTLPI